jgi:hypothetical protein
MVAETERLAKANAAIDVFEMEDKVIRQFTLLLVYLKSAWIVIFLHKTTR